MEEYVEVRNLVNHMVVYKIDDTHHRVSFNPFEVKKIAVEELRQLNYQYGGKVLLQNYLCVLDKELRKEFEISPDIIEYDWTLEDVDAALTTAPLDVLLDALDFAPLGIKDLLVDRAVELKIPDTSRRKAIHEATGIDVNNMIELKEQVEALNPTEESELPHTRRVNHTPARSGRRVQN